MIFLEQFGMTEKALANFFKDHKLHEPVELVQFC